MVQCTKHQQTPANITITTTNQTLGRRGKRKGKEKEATQKESEHTTHQTHNTEGKMTSRDSNKESENALDFERLVVMADEKRRQSGEHEAYLAQHPEVAQQLADFVGEVLVKQPDDVKQFARDHFCGMAGGTRQQQQQHLRPLVVMGPSGVGKGTVIGRLREREPDAFGFSVSHTTRRARAGEQDGVHYHFVAERARMDEMVRRGEFLEHAEVHGNLYGTSSAAVRAVSDAGKICILDIDVQGGRQLKERQQERQRQRQGQRQQQTKKKESDGDAGNGDDDDDDDPLECVFVFVEPPSMSELEKRLRGRGTEHEDAIQVRLRNARAEIEASYAPGFVDFRVVNDDVDRCVSDLLAAIAPELCRRRQILAARSAATTATTATASESAPVTPPPPSTEITTK
jgi:guanylate kinase